MAGSVVTELDAGAAALMARERAYAADEKADCAGLLLAEALLTGVGDVGLLMHEFRLARAAAHYSWCVYSETLEVERASA